MCVSMQRHTNRTACIDPAPLNHRLRSLNLILGWEEMMSIVKKMLRGGERTRREEKRGRIIMNKLLLFFIRFANFLFKSRGYREQQRFVSSSWYDERFVRAHIFNTLNTHR